MAAEPLMDAHGTQGFRGTLVEKHWPRQTFNYKLVSAQKSFSTKFPNEALPSNFKIIKFS